MDESVIRQEVIKLLREGQAHVTLEYKTPLCDVRFSIAILSYHISANGYHKASIRRDEGERWLELQHVLASF